MEYCFWNDSHNKKTKVNLTAMSNWQELTSKIDNKYLNTIWEMIDNNDGIIQENELSLLEKLLKIADNLISSSSNNNIIEDEEAENLINKIKDGLLTKEMKNNPLLVKNNEEAKNLKNYSYIENYYDEHNNLKIRLVNVDFSRVNKNGDAPEYIMYERMNENGIIKETAARFSFDHPELLNAKISKSQIGKQGWSEGINRRIHTIQIANKDEESSYQERLETVIKQLKAIGKEVGFDVETDYFHVWHEDDSILLNDGTRYFPNLNSNYDHWGFFNVHSSLRQWEVAYRGSSILYKQTIPQSDIVDGKSYLEGGNVLNTRLGNGTPAAIVGEGSIYYTLHTMFGAIEYNRIAEQIESNPSEKEKYFNLAKKQIAQDLHLKEENITYIPQLSFHIDMDFRPFQDGVIAIPDYEKGLEILKNISTKVEDSRENNELVEYISEFSKEAESKISNAEQLLVQGGYKVVKIPCFYIPKRGFSPTIAINYMNGIAGTSDNGETYYITNSSGNEELDNLMKEYFKEIGIEKTFFVSTKSFLSDRSGGIDCMTQEM